MGVNIVHDQKQRILSNDIIRYGVSGNNAAGKIAEQS